MNNRTVLMTVLVAFFLVGMMGSMSPVSAQALVDKSGKNWKLKLNTFFAYDDNVVNEPDRVSARPTNLRGKDDGAFNWSGNAQVKHSFNKKFSVRATYDIDMTTYFDLNQYDLTSQMFGISPTYKITPTMNVMFDYNFIYNIVDGNNFSGINYFGPSFNYMNSKLGLSRLYYNYKTTNNWVNDFRDNEHHTMGASQYIFFSNYTRRIKIDYQYSVEDTANSAFDRDNHRIALEGRTPLMWGINMDVDAVFTLRDYDSRLGSGTAFRDDTLQRYAIQFDKLLLAKWKCLQDLKLVAKYRHLKNGSNLITRDFTSNRGDIGLQARF